jgi:uncharacterized membrane protein YqjE
MTNSIMIIFFLGLVALVLQFFGVFDQCATWWSALVTIYAISLLFRIWHKEKDGEIEQLRLRIEQLEKQMKRF